MPKTDPKVDHRTAHGAEFGPDLGPDLGPDRKSTLGDGFRPSLSGWRDGLIILAISVWGLSAGAGFLMPLVLATLIFVLIIAIADGLHRRLPWLPGWLANIAGVLLVLTGFAAIVGVLTNQATQFIRALPGYESQFDAALDRITGLIGTDLMAMVRDLLVEVEMSQLARSAFGGATSFMNSFLLIMLYVGFMMAERRLMTRKILLAAANPAMGREISDMTGAITQSLQRYVGVKSLVSAITALFSYAVFRLLGLDFPETWAVLTFALNFIPSIGSVIAVIFPALVSLVQFDTVTPFLVIVLLCGTVQFLIGNLLDPAMLGRSLNLSSLMVILALTFWSAVWGLAGAFLSVPVTVCIVIVLSHIPATRPIAIVMSMDGQLSNQKGAT